MYFIKPQETSGLIYHTVIVDSHVHFAQVAVIAPGLTNERVTFLDPLRKDGVAMSVDNDIYALYFLSYRGNVIKLVA